MPLWHVTICHPENHKFSFICAAMYPIYDSCIAIKSICSYSTLAGITPNDIGL